MPYFPQGHPSVKGLRHLALLYGNAREPWTEHTLMPYVAHLNASGRPDDWFFDSFLFLNVQSAGGREYCADVNLGTTMAGEGDFRAVCSRRPGSLSEWEELLEFYLGDEGALVMLDRVIGRCLKEINHPYSARRNAVLMLPYPHNTQQDFGRVRAGGTTLDFSTARQSLSHATSARLSAERWFVEEIVRRSAGLHLRHVHLLGVYWMFETVYRSWDVDDHWLLKELRPELIRQDLKFLWIPYWSTYNVHLLDNYQKYYFDLAFLQPNYMFYREGKSVEAAAAAARERNAGIEMEYYLELDEPIAVMDERHERFRAYLDGGVQHGYMTEAACAHFHGTGTLQRMWNHPDPAEREFYDDIYRFVKGEYRVKGSSAGNR